MSLLQQRTGKSLATRVRALRAPAGNRSAVEGRYCEPLEPRVLLSGSMLTPSSVLVYSPQPEMHYGEAVKVKVLVTAPEGSAALPGGTVTLADDGGTVLRTLTAVDGRASGKILGLPRGYHHITASYLGDSAYNPLEGDSSLAVHVGAGTVVDILALYTPAAAAEIAGWGQGATIENLIYAAVADTNDALLNSRIDLSLELADVARIKYVESGSLDTDLTRLAVPNDGYMDSAFSRRNTYGADMVCLFVAAGDLGGLSYVMRDPTDPANSDYAFSVIMAEQAMAPTNTLAHELGHGFGAVHDREHAGSSSGVFADSHGYRYTGSDGVLYHDIMSYNPGETIPYYSNPDVSYAGEPTGRVGYSNVAGTINATAPLVANYRPTMVPLATPTTTTVSVSGGIIAGKPLTITAEVAGTLPNPHTPAGTIVFLDGNSVLDTAVLDAAGAATWTGTLSASTPHSIRALYQNDDYFGDSLSPAVTVNVAPVATVSLSTQSPRTNKTLIATATKSDPEGSAVSLTFVWKVNGVVRRTFTSATALTDSFDLRPAGNGDSGDTVTVRVIPNDGTASGAAAVASATVINSDPSVSSFTRTVNQGATLAFTATDFQGAFADPDAGDGLRKIRITSLPASGTLSLGGVPVVTDQTLRASRLGELTYTPAGADAAQDSFTWNAMDASTFAAADASATVAINRAPTDVTLSTATVSENLPAAAVVGRLRPVDPDTGDTFTYSLISGAEWPDNASFAIVGRRLVTAATFNCEAKSTYAIRVGVKDQSGLFCNRPLTITIGDVNEAPIDLRLSPKTILQDQPPGTAVGTFLGIDPDAGSTFTYTLVGGTGSADNALFTIDADTLRTASVLDYAATSTRSIRVRVTDQGGLWFERSLTIRVLA